MDTNLSTIAQLHPPSQHIDRAGASTPERSERPLYPVRVHPVGGWAPRPLDFHPRGVTPTVGEDLFSPSAHETTMTMRLDVSEMMSHSPGALAAVAAARAIEAIDDPIEQAYDMVKWANEKLQSGSLPQAHSWLAVRESYLTAAALFSRMSMVEEATQAFVQCAGISRVMRLAASDFLGGSATRQWSKDEVSYEYEVALALGCAAECCKNVDRASALDIIRDQLGVLVDIRNHSHNEVALLLHMAKGHRDAADLCTELNHVAEAEDHYAQAFAAYDDYDNRRGPGGTAYSTAGRDLQWEDISLRRHDRVEPLLPSRTLSLKRTCLVRRLEHLVQLRRYSEGRSALDILLKITEPRGPAARMLQCQRLLCGMCEARGAEYALIVHRCEMDFDRTTDLVAELRDGLENNLLRMLINALRNPSHESAKDASRAAEEYVERRRDSPHIGAMKQLLGRVIENISEYADGIARQAAEEMARLNAQFEENTSKKQLWSSAAAS